MSTKSLLTPRALPAEEIVVDQYASLDSRLAPVFPLPAVGFPVVTIPSNGGTPTIDSHPSIPERVAPSEVQRNNSSGNPLEQIDAICTLLDSADGPVGSGGVELITDYGVERIDIDLSAHAALPAGMSMPGPSSFDLEHLIGSTVVEVGRDLQRSLASTFPEMVNRERATKIDQLLDGIERSTRREYDVVEPGQLDPLSSEFTEPSDATQQFADMTSGVVPPPKHGYKNFFTMLRRRQTP
jgi:hypothetical protein